MKKYTRQKPFHASIKRREKLTGLNSTRKTFHVVLDTSGFDETFDPGDSLAIFPENDPQEVDLILQSLQAKGDEIISDPRSSEMKVRDFLSKKANIGKINRSLVTCLAEKGESPQKIKDLISDENKEALTTFLHSHTLKDLVHYGSFSIDEIAKLAMPLFPRFYSIANAQKVCPDEIHLLVAYVEYEVNGQTRLGVGSHFLCSQAEIGETVPIYVQPSNHFSVPVDPNTNIIMIGPGTGVAPYRAFMQERADASGENWLFFGERNEQTDFYYGPFWKGLENQGKLILDTAFSRDQEEKIYVQHRLYEKRKTLWEWISTGAIIYVCGDAKQMAKEVEMVICQIIQEEGNLSEEDALFYFRKMRKEKRYLADVY